jgi:hypothetical protein
LHGLAFQFAQRIRGDPTRGARILLADSLGHSDGGAIQRQVSLSDVAQRPVYGFADEIPLVVGFPFDDEEESFESGVGLVLSL